jgi:hypothetical protein
MRKLKMVNGGGGHAKYSTRYLPVPKELADLIPPDTSFYCHLTDVGILYTRAVDPPLPDWAHPEPPPVEVSA